MPLRLRRLAGEALSAALRDLAEFGRVTVPHRSMAQQIYEEAEAAGQKARIVKAAGRGWWAVEIVDMRPKGGADQ